VQILGFVVLGGNYLGFQFTCDGAERQRGAKRKTRIPTIKLIILPSTTGKEGVKRASDTKMAMLHPPYVSPMQWFFPMGQTAAVSLTQDLPPGKQANCLVLGNGDARNILFTLFNEQNNGITFSSV